MALSKMRSSSSVAVLLLALLANQAAAQEAAPAGDEEAAGTNEIIVTAQKRSESINSVPLSITAVSGDALQAQGVTDVAGLAKVTRALTRSTAVSARRSISCAVSASSTAASRRNPP